MIDVLAVLRGPIGIALHSHCAPFASIRKARKWLGYQWARLGSNQRPLACETCILQDDGSLTTTDNRTVSTQTTRPHPTRRAAVATTRDNRDAPQTHREERAMLFEHECVRCDNTMFVKSEDGLCAHCHWVVRGEIEVGLRELCDYLACWTKYEAWCVEHGVAA